MGWPVAGSASTDKAERFIDLLRFAFEGSSGAHFCPQLPRALVPSAENLTRR